MRFDTLVLPRQVDPDWCGSSADYESFPAQPDARQARKDGVRKCESFIQRLQAALDAFTAQFPASQRTSQWHTMYSAIGSRQAPVDGASLAAVGASASPAAGKAAASASAASAGASKSAASKGVCSFCHKAPEGKLQRCPCKQVRYCNQTCQLAHWNAPVNGHAQDCTASQ